MKVTHFIKPFLLFATLLGGSLCQAQTKETYYEMYANQLKQEKFTEAITNIQKLLDKQPENPVCLLFMGMAYEQEFYGISMYQSKDMETSFAKTKELFAKAADNLGGDEFRAGAPFIEELIKDKPNKKTVDAYIAAHTTAMAAYYDKVKGFMARLDAVEKVYLSCQDRLLPVVQGYPSEIEMQKKLSDEHWNMLEAVIKDFAPIKGTLEKIKADEISTGLKPAQLQDFQWAVMQGDGRNLMKAFPNDFRRQKPALFDMAKWATELQAKAKEVRNLHSQMEIIEKAIAEISGDEKDEQTIAKIKADIAAWKKQAMVYDDQFLIERILDYQIAKARYRSQAKLLEKRREASFIHREKMESLVRDIHANIDSARFRAVNILSDPAYYENQMAVYNRYGGKDGLENLRKAEDVWLLAERKYWADARFYAASLLSTIPDKMPYKGKTLLLRPADYKPAAAYEAGDMVVQRVFATNDANVIVVGRYKGKTKTQQPFLAKFDATGNMRWIRDFMADSLDGAVVSSPYSDAQGNTAFGFYFNGHDFHYRFEYIGPNGETLLYKEASFLPETIHPMQMPNGFLLVAEDHHDIETLHLQTIGLTGEPGVAGDFTLNGQLAGVHLQEGMARIVLNFFELKNDKGISLASKAAKGTNIAILTVKLDGSPVEIMPIDSPFSIATDMFIPQGKKLLLKGRKGNYHWNESKRLDGGDPWEFELE